MLDPTLQNQVNNTMSTLAVAQLLADKLPSLIKIQKKSKGTLLDFGDTSLGLTLSLLKLSGMTYKELVDTVVGYINNSVGKASLTAIETAIKGILLSTINGMAGCNNSPFLGDDLLDKHELNGREVMPPGLALNLNVLDTYNLFSKPNPTDPKGGYFYGDVPEEIDDCKPANIWKSGDMNAYLWYIMNMVLPEDQVIENRRIIWDDRNNTIKKGVVEGTHESYDFDEETLDQKTKKIMRVAFNEEDNNFVIYLSPERYYRKRQKKNKLLNKTIYDFNKDYISSLKILYPKPIIAGIMDVVTNSSITAKLSASAKLSMSESVLQSQIEEITEKIIENDDLDIENCFFTFSNKEYDELIRNAGLKQKGITTTTGDTIIGQIDDINALLEKLDEIVPSATFQEQKTIIEGAITEITGGKSVIDYSGESDYFKLISDMKYPNWSAKDFENKGLVLLKTLIKKIVSCIFTPKVMLIYLYNYSLTNGGKVPTTPMEFMVAFYNILKGVIKAILDAFIDDLFDKAIARLKTLIAKYVKAIVLERVEKYIQITLNLIQNCQLTLTIPNFDGTKINGAIDDVRNADILETQDTPKTDKC